MSEPRCEHCRFWERSSNECHRYAPRAMLREFYGLSLALARKDEEAEEVVGDDATMADFPRTLPGDWCGEFEAREAD